MFSRQLLANIARYASGEALARVASVAVMVFLGHRYSVAILGAYALAVTLSGYGFTLIDFGLRHIGARLMAQYPGHGSEIVYRVQRRRGLMACIAVPLILVYSVSTSFPRSLMLFVVLFSTTSTLYAASLEWAAWGKEHFQLVGGFRAIVPICTLIAVVSCRTGGDSVLWWAAGGNLAGYILQASVFWWWWKKQAAGPGDEVAPAAIRESLLWRTTLVMGFAWFAQIAFNSIDMLMLGIVSAPEQVGLYAAAYRLMSQILIIYYLAVLPLYPPLARIAPELRHAAVRPRIMFSLAGVGVCISIALSLLRRPLLWLVFGHSFLAAATLLIVLAWAIPLDFLTSYLNNAYIAWGMERKLLNCILVGAGTNVVLNLLLLPKYGAAAAAVNTIIAYLVYLAGLLILRRGVERDNQRKSTAVLAIEVLR
jgi:O-antigen/teichoic acid export membrane protein